MRPGARIIAALSMSMRPNDSRSIFVEPFAECRVRRSGVKILITKVLGKHGYLKNWWYDRGPFKKLQSFLLTVPYIRHTLYKALFQNYLAF